MKNTGMYNRIAGALYGVAVGDALGAPLEFMSAEEIQNRHGYVTDMIGGGWLNVEPGEITDDTQMTLCVAHGIVENPDDPIVEVGKRFIDWLCSGPKDVGGTCRSAITSAMSLAADRELPSKYDWWKASKKTHMMTGGRSAGNGTLMRTVYPGLYYEDLMQAINVAGEISEMTHFDNSSTQACKLYTLMVHMMVDEPDLERRQDVIGFALHKNVDDDAPYGMRTLTKPGYTPNPSGYVVDSFAAALHCILKTSCFKDAVAKAVNLGGDADTIGAITGGLAGALYGYDEIPREWVAEIDAENIEALNLLAAQAESHRNAD